MTAIHGKSPEVAVLCPVYQLKIRRDPLLALRPALQQPQYSDAISILHWLILLGSFCEMCVSCRESCMVLTSDYVYIL